jgi:hypothetical protein
MAFLVVVGMRDPYRPEDANVGIALFHGMFFSMFIGPIGLVGGAFLWQAGQRLHSLFVLRTRGISVVGTVSGYVRIWKKGSHHWKFSKLSFTTFDGQEMWNVPSVVSIWDFGRGRAQARVGAPVDVTYDPLDPTRASRPVSAGFLVRTLLVAAVGLVVMAFFVAAVLVFLLAIPV